MTSATTPDFHRKTAGWLNALWVLPKVGISVVLGGMFGSAAMEHGELREGPAAFLSHTLLRISVGIPIIVAGISFAFGHRWPRFVLWPVSVLFALLSFPLGTAIGGYTIWVLWRERHAGESATP